MNNSLLDFTKTAMEGFETQVQKATFNILCVTKRKGNEDCDFHLPITGVAVIRNITFVRADISFVMTTVTFDGHEYELSYVRNGLNGSALVIGVKNEDEPPYTEWELYTDTPSAMPDGGKKKTREEIIEMVPEPDGKNHPRW